MKTRLLTVAAVLMGVLSVLPTSAQAYEVVETSAVRLTPEHTLMTITYRFGFLNRELGMPVFTERNSERRGTTVGYNLVGSDGKVLTTGTTAAIVLSDAEIREREYHVPRGKNAEFTLVAFVRTTGITEDFKLALTRLPFTMTDDDVSVKAAVTADEIAAYQTNLIR
jgi:hypothetical protein